MLTPLKESRNNDVRAVYRLKALQVRVLPTSQLTLKKENMRKFFTTIKEWANHFRVWWMLHFRNTLVEEVEFEAYTITFRRFTMEITTKSGNMKLRTMGMLYPNSFLYNALMKGDEKIVLWFCNGVYQFVTLITQDNGLVQDMHKAFAKYYKRMEKKAESIAKEITPDEDKLNEEIINANIEAAEMTKDERKAHKEVIREVLTNDEE